MNVYGVSGLVADKRVFEHLTLDIEIIPIDSITPYSNESIKSYSKRLSAVIDASKDFALIGVSFGGLIATEINQILNAKKVILISSAQTKSELRLIYKWVGNSRILKLIPASLLNPPKFVAKYIMGAHNSKLFFEILDDTNLCFVKWALQEFTTWKNTNQSTKVIKINGTKDKLIPPKGNTRMKLIEGGEHFMIVDRANEISEIINFELKNT
ncbi:YqiA/YcfP family alpha/beta fold hydrolase [Maribacter caenipelagi]|uniref:YqiA/YcfP family alpha/beta fold hydrolase n=1 Tax=Maribacter caenipelagi TaxID=1447781 RepID=UPI00105CE63C|nr:YqiA/YcfP family alpha/beta fold hydrolase [Maribacter caenipelagi]